jgi:hypothetical protein
MLIYDRSQSMPSSRPTGRLRGAAPQGTIRRTPAHSGFFILPPGSPWWSCGFLSALAALLLIGLPTRREHLRAASALTVAGLLRFALGSGGGSSGGGGGGRGSGPTPTTITLTTTNAKVDQIGLFTITGQVTAQHAVTGTVVLTIQGNARGDVHFLNATIGLQ